MNNKSNETKILGVKVSPLTYFTVLKTLSSFINSGKKAYICVAAVHLLMECQKDIYLRDGVNNALFVTPDGMPLVWFLRYKKKQTERIYGPDLTLKLCAAAEEKQYSIFLLGGIAGQTKILIQKLKEKYPKLKIVGAIDTPHGSMSSKKNKEIIKQINNKGADIVFIGMGCPYQERWMIEHIKEVDRAILIGVGAAFNFISGKVKQAPVWMRQAGLEWTFRFLQEPSRLWRRYLLGNASFLKRLCFNLLYERS